MKSSWLIGRTGPRTSALALELARVGVELEQLLATDLEELADEPEDRPWIYLAASADPQGLQPDLDEAEAVSTAWRRRAGSHLIVISSAAAEEPNHHHPLRLDESRTVPTRFQNPLSRAWKTLEEVVSRARDEPETPHSKSRLLTLLRPAPWPIREGSCWWAQWLRAGRAAMGFDPNLQLLSVEDLASMVALCLSRRPETGGEIEVYHVAPAGVVPARRALASAGCAQAWIARSLRRPWGSAFPEGQRDFIRYPFTVHDAKAREQLGYAPRFSSEDVAAQVAPEVAAGSRAEPRHDREHDPFGLDRAYLERYSRTLFRFLHNVWWRVEYRGLEHIPRRGKGVLVGVHRGFQPWDGVMFNFLIARELGRVMRFLVHPALLKFPCLAPYMTKLGGVPACRENGDWVLRQGRLLAIFPEGIRGAFRRYDADIYRLGKMGRDEYVRFALRSGAPIVPFVTIGQAEIYPIFRKIDWRWWKRLTEWPAFPITPTLGLVPLPSKWHTRVLEPIPVDHLPPDAADDAELVATLGAEVKGRMQEALDDLLARRARIVGGKFRGSIFPPEETLPQSTEREPR